MCRWMTMVDEVDQATSKESCVGGWEAAGLASCTVALDITMRALRRLMAGMVSITYIARVPRTRRNDRVCENASTVRYNRMYPSAGHLLHTLRHRDEIRMYCTHISAPKRWVCGISYSRLVPQPQHRSAVRTASFQL